MCGRYNIVTSAQGLYDAFKILSDKLDFEFVAQNYNIHPSPPDAVLDSIVTAPIIRYINNQYEALPAVWPLIPLWAKGKVSKYSTANARMESLSTTRSYQHAWKQNQRCLVPATGFYEWQIVEGQKNKQPYNIILKNTPVFAMAGLWENSLNPDTNQSVNSFTIITTEANPLMARIHNSKKRMPVIVEPREYANWLKGSNDDKILVSYPEDNMLAYKVSTAVNNPNNNDSVCVEKI